MRAIFLVLMLAGCASISKGIQKTTTGNNEYPSLTKPKLRSMWVPDQIEGNKYIEGHYIYIIEDPGSWTKD